jgi:tRNA (mo5U34)-methyltransferase
LRAPASIEELRQGLLALGPWHIEVQVTPELSTAASLEVEYEEKMDFYRPREGAMKTLDMLYPQGLGGKAVLDCACNCGAHLFWAKEKGAGRCLGFDVREHWIKQARFLLEHRTYPSDDMHFEVCDLYELPSLAPQPVDLTFFRGIFYHLPDPIAGLKIAADLTREVIIVNTATWNALPDGALVSHEEPDDMALSGVYGLNWFPTGPEVMGRILAWLGFPEYRCHWWKRDTHQRPELGRIQIIAARDAKYLAAYDRRPGK